MNSCNMFGLFIQTCIIPYYDVTTSSVVELTTEDGTIIETEGEDYLRTEG